MSYEGYEQILCANGHYHTEDAYENLMHDFEEGYVWKCRVCGAEKAWCNGVNTTNGSFDVNPDTGEQERIDGYIELEIDIPAMVCGCPTCGHKHEIQPPRYKIPVRAVESDLVDRAKELVDGVDVDLDAPLSPDDE